MQHDRLALPTSLVCSPRPATRTTVGRVVSWSSFAVGLTCGLMAQDAVPAGRVIAIHRQVEVQQTDWKPAVIDQEVFQGNHIRTGAESRAALLLVDDTQLKIAENTHLELTKVEPSRESLFGRLLKAVGLGESEVDLSVGEVWMRSRQKPANVIIKTPAVTAAIRGTEASLAVDAQGVSVLTVVHGTVDFSNDQGSVSVAAGERGRAVPGQAPTKTVVANPDNAVQWTFFYSAQAGPGDYPFAGAPLAASPESLSDPVEKARAYWNRGDLQSAQSALSGASADRAAEIQGWIALRQGDPQAALQALSQAPDSPRTHLGRSLAHQSLGDWAAARADVADAADDPLARLQLARLDLLAGRVEQARARLEQVQEGEPGFGLSQGLLADILIVQNRRDAALRAARQAVQASPQSSSAQLHLSRAFQSLFDLEAARTAAEKAVELDAQSAEARVQLARILFGQGRSEQAERQVREALEASPQDGTATSLLGFIQLAQGRTQAARGQFDTAILRDPTLSEPRLGLGLVDIRQGRSDDAALHILQAVTIDPRISLYQSYLAKAYYEERRFEMAFDALDIAEELDPRDPTPHLYAGIFWNDLNLVGSSIEELRESIRLNDNRAVYRSRFLLDQDRATRNVQLATSYNRLGLEDRAGLQAVRSLADDPANSSAHLFLAGAFLNLKGLTSAAGSELLWTRLLQPVNANSFNTFNDYTTLFERPQVNGTLEGDYGSFDSATGRAIATGGTTRFAFQAAFQYDRTAGFRPLNDFSQSYTGLALVKFALSPRSDFFLSYTHNQTNQGDPSAVPVVTDSNDRNIRFFTRIDQFEGGFRRQFGPHSNLVAVVSVRGRSQVIDNPDFRVSSSGFLQSLRRSERDPDVSLQVAHQLSVRGVQLQYGFDSFEGRRRRRDLLTTFVVLPDEVLLVPDEASLLRDKVRYRRFFADASLRPHPRLRLTGGLDYDWSNDDLRDFSILARQRSDERWNPRGAALWNPFDTTTLRIAASRTRQQHARETLAPTHLFGLPLGQNELELTRSDSVETAWEQWVGRHRFQVDAFFRDRATPVANNGANTATIDFDSEIYGGKFVYDRMLGEGLTLVGRYGLVHDTLFNGFAGATPTSVVRHEHEASGSLYWVHPSGLSASVSESYFRQGGRLSNTRLQTEVWTTDIAASYEFPRKWALLAFEGRNLFDRRYVFLADPLDLDPRVPRRQWRVTLSVNF